MKKNLTIEEISEHLDDCFIFINEENSSIVRLLINARRIDFGLPIRTIGKLTGFSKNYLSGTVGLGSYNPMLSKNSEIFRRIKKANMALGEFGLELSLVLCEKDIESDW